MHVHVFRVFARKGSGSVAAAATTFAAIIARAAMQHVKRELAPPARNLTPVVPVRFAATRHTYANLVWTAGSSVVAELLHCDVQRCR